jgi:hypothetical protein
VCPVPRASSRRLMAKLVLPIRRIGQLDIRGQNVASEVSS